MENVRGVAHGFVDVVRDHDDGNAVAEVHKLDEIIHLTCGDGVKPRHRLVEQQELFRRAQRAGEKDSLLLAAGQRVIARVGKLFDAHTLHVHLHVLAVGLAVKQPPAEGI